jgi:hypothetical protein
LVYDTSGLVIPYASLSNLEIRCSRKSQVLHFPRKKFAVLIHSKARFCIGHEKLLVLEPKQRFYSNQAK